MSVVYLQAQRPMEIQLTTEDGLPSNSVYRAVQDNQGYMWFSTDKGVAKFDGYQFEVFNTNKGIPHNDVFDIILDGDKIWLSTFDTISYLKDNRVYGLKKPKSLQHISQFDHRIQPSGFHHFKTRESRTFTQIKNDSIIIIKQLTEDESLFSAIDENNYTVGRHDTDMNIRYLDKYRDNKLADSYVTNMSTFHSVILNEKKISFDKDKILIWDYDTPTFTSFTNTIGKQVNIKAYTVFENKLLIYTEKENFILDEDLNLVKDYQYLIDREFNSIIRDNNGNIWACGESGISFFRNEKTSSHVYKNTYFDDKFIALNADKYGSIIVTTRQGRILDYTEGKELNLKFKLNVSDATKLELDPQSEHCYILDRKKGFLKYTYNEDTPREVKYTGPNYPRADKDIDIQENGTIALSYFMGAYLIEGDSTKYFFNERTYAVCFQGDTIWLGTTRGLFHHVDGVNTAFPLNGENFYVKSIHKDNNNNIWIIPDKAGLWKIANGKVQKIENVNDLYINDISVDEQNNIWLATTTGLFECVYDKEKKIYTRRQHGFLKGIQSKNIIETLVVDNMVYAISDQFLYVFDKLKNNKTKNSNFIINSISTNDNIREFDTVYTLSHRENNLKVDYNCISSGDFGKIIYKWKLEPSQDKWQTTQATNLQFNSLSPGGIIH